MGNGSFVPSINVESCIIEEQDDHLVLAVRVPKATIANNMALLGALAECCGGDDQRVWSTRTDPPIASHRFDLNGGSGFSDRRKSSDLETPLMEIVFISQVLEREVARAVNDPNDHSALTPLTVLAVKFSDLVHNLDDVSHLYSGDHLVQATRAMSDQVGRVGNNPGDLEEVKTLQVLIAHVAKWLLRWKSRTGLVPPFLRG
jgi:hypothetical protein